MNTSRGKGVQDTLNVKDRRTVGVQQRKHLLLLLLLAVAVGGGK